MAEPGDNANGTGDVTDERTQQDEGQPSAESNTPPTSRAHESDRRNIMQGKFDAVDYAELEEVHRKAGIALAEREARAREAKELYFFYGSLMFPEMLQHVLDLPRLPELKPAEIVGFRIKVWGPYPALVDGEVGVGEIVQGMAYEVETPEHKDKLASYETECYRTRQLYIRVDGLEEEVLGTTFEWNGSADELDEGTFDAESWKKRMKRILNL